MATRGYGSTGSSAPPSDNEGNVIINDSDVEVASGYNSIDTGMIDYLISIGVSEEAAQVLADVGMRCQTRFADYKSKNTYYQNLIKHFATSFGSGISVKQGEMTDSGKVFTCSFNFESPRPPHFMLSMFTYPVKETPRNAVIPDFIPMSRSNGSDLMFNPNLYEPMVVDATFLTNLDTPKLIVRPLEYVLHGCSPPHSRMLVPMILSDFHRNLQTLVLDDLIFLAHTIGKVCESTSIRHLKVRGFAAESLVFNRLAGVIELELSIVPLNPGQKHQILFSGGNIPAIRTFKLNVGHRIYYDNGEEHYQHTLKMWNIVDFQSRSFKRFELIMCASDFPSLLGVNNEGVRVCDGLLNPSVADAPIRRFILNVIPDLRTDGLYWNTPNDVFVSSRTKIDRQESNVRKLVDGGIIVEKKDQSQQNWTMFIYTFKPTNILSPMQIISFINGLKLRRTKVLTTNDFASFSLRLCEPKPEPLDPSSNSTAPWNLRPVDYFGSCPNLSVIIIRCAEYTDVKKIKFPGDECFTYIWRASNIHPDVPTAKPKKVKKNRSFSKSMLTIDFDDMPILNSDMYIAAGFVLIYTNSSRAYYPSTAERFDSESNWTTFTKSFYSTFQSKFTGDKSYCGGYLFK